MSADISEQFEPETVQAGLLDQGLEWIQPIEYFDSIVSTNDYLMSFDGALHGRLCVAAYQSAGKGRHGRRWHSVRGRNLMFSLGWVPQENPGPKLSLLVGVAIADALTAAGVQGVGLKWPNDVLLRGAKLAGILLESRVIGGKFEYVIGVGLNLEQSPEEMASVETPWTDLAMLGEKNISRERWLLNILISLDRRLQQLQQQGFSGISDDWTNYHLYQGAEMKYQYRGASCVGRVIGLDEDGALQLQTDGQVLSVQSGEINTLRPLS